MSLYLVGSGLQRFLPKEGLKQKELFGAIGQLVFVCGRVKASTASPRDDFDSLSRPGHVGGVTALASLTKLVEMEALHERSEHLSRMRPRQALQPRAICTMALKGDTTGPPHVNVRLAWLAWASAARVDKRRTGLGAYRLLGCPQAGSGPVENCERLALDVGGQVKARIFFRRWKRRSLARRERGRGPGWRGRGGRLRGFADQQGSNRNPVDRHRHRIRSVQTLLLVHHRAQVRLDQRYGTPDATPPS